MRLHIVRHGQTQWNAERRIQGQLESELNSTGIQQAIDRGTELAGLAWTNVYSSSSLRTRQTTQHLLGDNSQSVTYRDDLREVRLGVWQGRYWEDVEKSYPEKVEAHRTASPDFDVVGAERSQDVQERGVGAIESIIAAHSQSDAEDNILVVSHGAIMLTILAHYSDLALGLLHTLPALPNCAHCIIGVNGNERIVETIASVAFADTPWEQAPKIGTADR